MGLATVALAEPSAQVGMGTPVVDGQLEESVWQRAPPVTEFLRFQPIDGGPPEGKTEVFFLQDERALYVGIRVSGVSAPVRARISQRERINADDQVGIYLDTFRDGRTGYIFYLNALGIQQDIRHNDGNWNVNWDTAFRSKGHVTEDGYELEVMLPWRSLKYPGQREEQTWGLILTRKVPGSGEKFSFPKTERSHPRIFQQAAALQGLRPPSKGSGVELIPSLTGRYAEPAIEGPWYQRARPSLDVRLGLTPDVGLTGTVLPDFSDVESDVTDVRLNARFAYFVQERRAFFLDGIENYQDRAGTLYTRSINEPLVGLKLTGREGPVSVGMLHTLDANPLPSFHEDGAPGFTEAEVQDTQAATTMLRLKSDAFGGGSVGVVFADKRSLSQGGGHFDTGGVDLDVPLGGRWMGGWSTQHSVTGAQGQVDLWGQQNEASITRASGVGTGVRLAVIDRTPGLRDEVGFLTQSGLTRVNGMVDHTVTLDQGPVDVFRPGLDGFFQTERDGDAMGELSSTENLTVQGIHRLWAGGGVQGWRQQGVEQVGPFGKAGYSGQVGKLFEWTPQVRLGRTLDFVELIPATTSMTSLDATLRAGGMRIDATTRFTTHQPEAQRTQRSLLLRGRMNLQFTRALGLRVVQEHTSGTLLEEAALRGSVLISWLDVPGTAVFLGYSEDRALSDGERAGWGVFGKASVLLRL